MSYKNDVIILLFPFFAAKVSQIVMYSNSN